MYIRKKNFALSFTVRAVFMVGMVLLTLALYGTDHKPANTKDISKRSASKVGAEVVGVPGRHLLEEAPSGVSSNVTGSTDEEEDGTGGGGQVTTASSDHKEEEEEHCTPPAYHEFPADLFTHQQRKHGAFILHLILVIYMFIALAIVCDLYFVSSLEKICEKLNMSEDVAGATFMAAGSSAPELFTSIIGVFVAKGDVGVGTIVGSAVFNILFVIGLCGILVEQVVQLSWYPLLRDSLFYSLSVIILMTSISNTRVDWYEAMIMLLLYVLYIIIMKYNSRLQTWFTARIHIFDKVSAPIVDDTSTILPPPSERKYYGGSYEMFGSDVGKGAVSQDGVTQGYIQPPVSDNQATTPVSEQIPIMGYIPVDEYVLKSTRKLSFEDACFRFMKGIRFRPLTRFKAGVYIVICERRKLLKDPMFMRGQLRPGPPIRQSKTVPFPKEGVDGETQPEIDWRRIPSLDEGIFPVIKWVVCLPICVLLYYTVPDCKQPRWDKWFMVSFLMAIVWIAFFSYIMVWMVTLVGYTIGIPDSIMGITFLAAGTSVPDAMASVMVARQGQGDMAVSNTIGSNVFDICIGLALPWFIKTAMVSPGNSVHINSNGMVFSVLLLFLTVIITICSIHMRHWRLDKMLGVVCLVSYAIFLTISIMIEFNVFGYVNAPMCIEG